jgi:hypothetical protein
MALKTGDKAICNFFSFSSTTTYTRTLARLLAQNLLFSEIECLAHAHVVTKL